MLYFNSLDPLAGSVLNRANRRVGAGAGAITRGLPSRVIFRLTANIEPRLGIIVRSHCGGNVTHAHTHVRAHARANTHTHPFKILDARIILTDEDRTRPCGALVPPSVSPVQACCMGVRCGFVRGPAQAVRDAAHRANCRAGARASAGVGLRGSLQTSTESSTPASSASGSFDPLAGPRRFKPRESPRRRRRRRNHSSHPHPIHHRSHRKHRAAARHHRTQPLRRYRDACTHTRADGSAATLFRPTPKEQCLEPTPASEGPAATPRTWMRSGLCGAG